MAMIEDRTSLSIREIMEILPHRYPMLLVDRITEYEPKKRAAGYKNLTINEPFFQGHFPGNPLMPGVYIIEAMAQLGGTLVVGPDDFRRRAAVLTGIEKARFRRPVVPGDRLDMEAIFIRMRSRMGWCMGTAHVAGKLVCSAEMMFSLTDVDEPGTNATVVRQ
jgi:3-hydroxyacyl-[acyl-carrier-protein] dehydratase